MFEVIIISLLTIILIYAMHFIVINVGNLKKKEENKIIEKKNFFAILIAARNEETVIENLIKSLKNQNYPKDKYEIYVIANNCTDNTAKVSKKAGATVIECKEKVKSKGEVLKYTFNKLKDNNEIDVYAIFDADNIVDNNFLNEMNNTVNEGYNVSQGFRDTKNIGDNWITSSYAILYYMDNLFINRARYNMKQSSFLNGTGFIVTKAVIDKYGYNPKTLTEDVEFTTLCALNNEKIAFTEKAITYDEQVVDLKTSLKQRKRWSFGTFECFKIYYKDLLKKTFKEKKYSPFDVLLFVMSTLIHVLLYFTLLLISIYMIININTIDIKIILLMNLFSIISYICGVILRIFVIKKYNKRIKDTIGGIILFDLFMLTWLPINIICLFINKCNWDSIKHDRNVDIEKI